MVRFNQGYLDTMAMPVKLRTKMFRDEYKRVQKENAERETRR